MREFVKGEEMEVGVGAGIEEFVGKEGGGFVGGDAAIFLVPLFLVNALSPKAFEEGVAGFIGAGFFVDAFDDAFGDGFLDGNFVQGPALCW